MNPSRKPRFLEQDDSREKDNFELILDTELAAVRTEDPHVAFEKVLQQTAQKFPEQYELHNRRIGGDQYATIDTTESPYFRKVADILFNELKKVDRGAQYSDAVAISAGFYPQLFEQHVSEKIGVSLPQRAVQLSDRRKVTTNPAVKIDRFRFARKALPTLVQDHLDELRVKNPDAGYQQALSETASHFVELYQDYNISLSA